MPTSRTDEKIPRQAYLALGTGRLHVANFRDNPEQLLWSRDSRFHLLQSILTERDHPGRQGGVPKERLPTLHGNMPPELVGDWHDFVDTEPPAITRLAARITADFAIEHQRGRFRVRDAQPLANQLRIVVEERLHLRDFRSDHQFPVTVSIGVLVAETVDRNAQTDDLLAQAEEAVGRAKQAGRNRVEYVDVSSETSGRPPVG